MIIPYQQLDKDTLNNLIEAFVLQEGTDYGEQEKTLQEKVEDVYKALKTEEVVIVFSELHETVNIMPKAQFNG